MIGAQILVLIDQQGNLQVRSNVEDVAKAVGLLELAKDAIKPSPQPVEQSPVLQARALPRINGKGG